MSSDNKGIALLLQAEKEAGKIIQDARDGTTWSVFVHLRLARKARIQQAKLEAKRDIDAYLADRNAAFNAFKNEVSSPSAQLNCVAPKRNQWNRGGH